MFERKLAEIKRTAKWADANTSDADAILDELQAQLGFISRDKFVKLEQIGKGQFGTVFKVWRDWRRHATPLFEVG